MIKLDDLEVYKVAVKIGDIVWNVVEKWNYFERDTLGKQIVRSADSIALNISEGYGRFHFAENRNFCNYSRGSAYETSTAIHKAFTRKLLSDDEYNALKEKLNLYLKLVNAYIRSIGNNGNKK